MPISTDNLGLRPPESADLARDHCALADWLDKRRRLWSDAALAQRHGDWRGWRALIERLPRLQRCGHDLRDGVCIQGERRFGDAERQILMGLHPWRKGPFTVCGLEIDAEWRSDIKWARLAGCLGDMAGQRIIDIGGGNGYYALRLCAQRPSLVLCLEPNGLYWAQHQSLRQYIEGLPLAFLPIALESFDAPVAFDLALSLGLIYHCREPLAHLARLRRLLRDGGRLILESLVIEGRAKGLSLAGGQRYAMMRNVWHLPTCEELLAWLGEAGFGRARIIDVSATTVAEQRRTPWMRFHSLADFLMPGDETKTREGLPAPVRALVEAIAEPL